MTDRPERSSQRVKVKGLYETVRFYLVDLQILTPITLFCFAAATLGFIIGDTVEENSARKAVKKFDAGFDVTDASMRLSEIAVTRTRRLDVEGVAIIRSLMREKELEAYAGQLSVAGGYASVNQSINVASILTDIQLSIFADVDERIDRLRARGGLLMSHLLNMHLSQQVAAGLLQVSEGSATSKRGISAAGIDLLCAPRMADWVAHYVPAATALVSCDTTAQSDILRATIVDTSLEPDDFSGTLDELRKTMEAYRILLQDIRSEFVSGWENSRDYSKRITVLAIAFVISVIGTITTVLLVSTQYRSLREQSVVESDFDCNAQRVKIRPGTLKAVDEIASRVGVMGDLSDVYLHPSDVQHRPSNSFVPAVVGNQIELHLRRAVEPLLLLRPFVPKYMYLNNLRSQSFMARSASALLRNNEMLNLTVGLRKKPASILFVGLRPFNTVDAELQLLNELLSAVHLACTHYQGHVIQMTSAGVVATFSRAVINEDHEEEERVEDGEVLAVHAAMAVLSICSAPLERPDGSIRAPFPVSMSVAHSMSFSGVLSFHVSKQFTLLAPAVAHAVAIEPLNDIHSTAILTTSTTNDLIGDHFVTRPVHYLPGVGSVYHVIVTKPNEVDEGYEQAVREQAKLREKTSNWSKVWEKYETLVSTDKPSYEMLEDAHRDLEGYKVFQMEAQEEDVAFQLAVANVKRIAQNLGVNLGSTVEEE